MTIFIKTHLFVWIYLLSVSPLFAQIEQAKPSDDEINPHKADLIDSLEIDRHRQDSLRIEELTFQLQEMKLNEILLRSEVDKTAKADSIKRTNIQKGIDSLRIITPGVPVVIENDTLFKLYARKGGLNPRDRAINIQNIIYALGKSLSLKKDTLSIFDSEISTDIMCGEKVIMSITNQDGLWQNKEREELAKEYLPLISHKIDELNAKHGLMITIKRVGFSLTVVILQIVFIILTVKLFKKLRRRIVRFACTNLKPIKIKDYEFLNAHKQGRILLFLSVILRLLLIIIQLLISIPLLFSIFPETKNVAFLIFSYLWDPLKAILISIVKFIPDLFKIIVIYLCFKYIIRGLKYLCKEIATEKLKINGFYSDWAYPTYYIIRALCYSFMVIMIWPLLPNSESPVFSGVSVFIGLIISLGSTTVIGNLMAGMVITYMRAFKIGDRIKLHDTVGDVIEKTPFVTRIRTIKNEIVTIPNSFILSSHTINYSNSAQQYGLIIHTTVTVGYDVHWKKVHELLLKAANDTPYILKNPKPFVLNLNLDNSFAGYEINGFIQEDKKLSEIYSVLRQQIQDRFNEAGIEMTTPLYYAQRDGNETMIPQEYKNKINNG